MERGRGGIDSMTFSPPVAFLPTPLPSLVPCNLFFMVKRWRRRKEPCQNNLFIQHRYDFRSPPSYSWKIPFLSCVQCSFRRPEKKNLLSIWGEGEASHNLISPLFPLCISLPSQSGGGHANFHLWAVERRARRNNPDHFLRQSS